jgi:hypothetical protein
LPNLVVIAASPGLAIRHSNPPDICSILGGIHIPSTTLTASYACFPRLLVLVSTLRFSLPLPTVLSTVMDSFSERKPKQASYTKPTIEEMEEWDADQLLEWIQRYRPSLLKGDKVDKFKEPEISGRVFLMLADNVEFFKKECKLPA